MKPPDEWTLDELVSQVAAELATPAYRGAPNARVRDVPDRRAVRWYSTIGLVDRPAAMKGRTALYGPRHVLQLVAIKRRQAEGRSLAQIQTELAGATDEMLRRVAGTSQQSGSDASATGPATEPAQANRGGSAVTEPRGKRTRFWADQPGAELVASPRADDANSVTVLAAVSLPGGALILLPGHPKPSDVTEIQAAAQPLLDLLADRGLLSSDDWRTP